MLKNGLAALLTALFVFGGIPATAVAPQQACAMGGCDCCCGACHCPVKGGHSCVSCVRAKTDLAVIATQPVVKPRISIALYLLPESKPADLRPFFARYIRGLDPSPPSDGSAHQALLRLWLI
jgi:hypothetical protein